MPTAVWRFASYDTGFSPFQVMPNCDIVIPPTATLKRFLITETGVAAFHSGDNVNLMSSIFIHFTVKIISGQYSPRDLYHTRRRIPMIATSLEDPIHAERIHSQWCEAGDLELGVDQKCSYGTADGPGFTVRMESYIHQVIPTGFGIPNGNAAVTFRALYLLP